jgi:sugar lactone lactonase YvrE
MPLSTRRTFLGAVGAVAVTAGLSESTAAERLTAMAVGSTSEITTVVDFDPANLPESIAFSPDDDLYFSLPTSAEGVANVRGLPAARTGESGLPIEATEPVETLPGNPIGVTLAPDGDALYAAVAHGEIDVSGAYRVCLTDQPMKQLGAFGPFPNDPVVDIPNDRLLVTESFTGSVYAVPLDGGDPTVWFDDPLLDPASENGFGANGITLRGRDLYIANSSTGSIVRVPIGSQGAAGPPEVYIEAEQLVGADGIRFRGRALYAAINAQNAIRRIGPDGEIETVVEGGVLDFPSDVAFGGGRSGADDLFIANFAAASPDTGGGPRILRRDRRD